MQLSFHKYQGTGNDFVMIDNRKYGLGRDEHDLVALLCDRRFGIGADGLILLNEHADYDFEMVYYNADGKESTLCGNGGRCIIDFAHYLGLVKKETEFLAVDGPHKGVWVDKGHTKLKMNPVSKVEEDAGDYVLNTGSPQFIRFVSDLDKMDVAREGAAIRYSDRFKAEGINVNFVEAVADSEIKVRTYERGVEDETLSCGTGVTASSIAHYLFKGVDGLNAEIKVHARGGDLKLSFAYEPAEKRFSEIWLEGPVQRVFEGSLEV